MDFQTKTYRLSRPIIRAGHPIGPVTLTEPDVAGLDRMEHLGLKPNEPMSIEQTREVLAIVSDLPRPAIAELDDEDLRALAEMSQELLARGGLDVLAMPAWPGEPIELPTPASIDLDPISPTAPQLPLPPLSPWGWSSAWGSATRPLEALRRNEK